MSRDMTRKGSWDVTFEYTDGTQTQMPVPLRDLSQTPFICSDNSDGTHMHWLQTDGDSVRRHYTYAGVCEELPNLRHAFHGHEDAFDRKEWPSG